MESASHESRIRADARLLTLINVFTVEPDRQDELVELLERATNEVIADMPGFVSANFHRSLDGSRVVNYAQWESRAAFEAMLQHPAARPHLRAAGELATFEPVLCEVTSVHHR